ncbi:MAG TPA: exo-alpha-sialidase [Cyclobacteriaceae bacterium]|nr:exo-alpha-sialidase [Cyclobacteriaceae bacterium]
MRKSCLIILISLFFVACSTHEKTEIVFIDNPTEVKSLAPYLFTGTDGKIYMTWIEKQADINYLKISSYQSSAWSAPNIIASGTDWFVNWADYPIAAELKGQYLAAFLKKSGSGTYAYDILLHHSNKLNEWQGPKLLHDDGKQAEHGFISIIPYGENFFTAWLDGRNTVSDDATTNHGHHNHHGEHGAMTVRAAIVDAESNKIAEWEIDERVCDCCQTTAAITANGPVVIYRDRSEDEIRDIYISRFTENEWTSPQAVFADNWKINACPVNGPRADAFKNSLAVAWFTAANAMAEVKVAFSLDNGESFGLPLTLNQTAPIGRVDLAMLDEKTAMVSWMEGAEIKAAKVHHSGRIEKIYHLDESTAKRSGGFPQMTRSNNLLMFAWTDDENEKIKTAYLQLND